MLQTFLRLVKTTIFYGPPTFGLFSAQLSAAETGPSDVIPGIWHCHFSCISTTGQEWRCHIPGMDSLGPVSVLHLVVRQIAQTLTAHKKIAVLTKHKIFWLRCICKSIPVMFLFRPVGAERWPEEGHWNASDAVWGLQETYFPTRGSICLPCYTQYEWQKSKLMLTYLHVRYMAERFCCGRWSMCQEACGHNVNFP